MPRVVGTQRKAITAAAVELLTDPEVYAKMAGAINPYGDGYAAQRIVAHLMAHDQIIAPAITTRSSDFSGLMQRQEELFTQTRSLQFVRRLCPCPLA